MHKKSSHINNMYTSNSHKKLLHKHYENKYFAAINKHKAKIYDQCTYTQILFKKIYFFSSPSIRMSGNSINFEDKKIKKSDFYNNKKILDINDIDVNEILIPKKEKYGKYNSFKYFIGYNDNNVIKPLYLELSQMIGYINKFNENKNKNKNKNTITMSLKVEDKKLFKNYNEIWKNIEKWIGKDFNTTLIYGDDNISIKTKTKTYEDNITTNFYNKKDLKSYQKKKCHINVCQ